MTQWLRETFLKQDEAATQSSGYDDRPIEAIEAELHAATDKERLIGLTAAPLAAAIGIAIINALIANDPPARLKNGALNKLHVSVTTYHDVLFVLVGLALVMLGTAFFRKRLYFGIAAGLYGLAVFNLHYWGFGIPFLLLASWYLVRSYRLQRAYKEASTDIGGPQSSSRGTRVPTSKRYTPPSVARTRLKPTTKRID